MVLVSYIYNVFVFGLVDYSAFLTMETQEAIFTLLVFAFIWFILFKAWGWVFQ